MSWISYFYPQTIALYTSRYNKDIRVVESFGKNKLLVNGSPQSGPYIESLWNRVIQSEHIHASSEIPKILLFGIGGGTVIQIIKRLQPNSTILAVDIDPIMVEIANKYFELQNINGLQMSIDDARIFVDTQVVQKIEYDLIIIDLFIGRHVPDFVNSDEFLKKLHNLLKPNTFVIINYLREKEYAQKSDILLDKLHKIFHSVIDKKIFLNRFFICSK